MALSFIEQKRAFVTIHAEIEPDGVAVRESGLLGSYRAKIPFEEIPDNPAEYAQRPLAWLGLAVLAAAVSARLLAGFFVGAGDGLEPACWAALVAGGAGFRAWVESARLVGYSCSSGRLVFFDRAGAGSPRGFLAELQRCRSEYFRDFAEAAARGEVEPGETVKKARPWLH